MADAVTGHAHSGVPDLDGRDLHDRSVIAPVKEALEGFEGAGYGRIIRFHSPQSFQKILKRIRNSLGTGAARGLCVAVPQSHSNAESYTVPITSIGLCAGSGGSFLNSLDVDLLFTGELSHHEALAAIEQGKCVVTAFHSNTERGFLVDRMKQALENEIREAIMSMAQNNTWDTSLDRQALVHISAVDRDPFEIVRI